MDVVHVGKPALCLLIEDASQVGHARREAVRLATTLSFDEADLGRVALVTTELSTNLLKHATRGVLYLSVVPGKISPGLEAVTIDQGPGFELHRCLADGYSSRGTQGIGLGGIARQSQMFDAWSDDKGSVVISRLYGGTVLGGDLRVGACQVPLAHEPVSGDGWAFALDARTLSVMVVDGLGHGILAHDAATAASEGFSSTPFDSQLALIERLHSAMSATRGGAVALAQMQLETGALSYLGVGNIAGCTVSDEGSRGLASMPGIVGGAFRRPQAFHSQVERTVLVMHSDGLSARWNLRDYPGLLRRHPAVVAWVLHRDASRGRDDATVVVFDLGALR